MSTVASMPPNAPTISLLIATYNWPQALACVLASVRAQRVAPLEVVIADDGSRDDTRRLIEREAQHFPVPIVHVWHEDTGFRLAAIRNKAIAQARGEYLVQIDGDIVLGDALSPLGQNLPKSNVILANPPFFSPALVLAMTILIWVHARLRELL